MKLNIIKRCVERASHRNNNGQEQITGQRLGLRQPSAAFTTQTSDRRAAEGCRSPRPRGISHPARVLLTVVTLLTLVANLSAADKYSGTCNIVFEGDSTLHAFTGDITNLAVVVLCDTNSTGVAVLNTRLEIAPKQLTTHHAKRDKNMYVMFKPDQFPKLTAVVTNAPLASAKLSPTAAAGANGTLPMQLTFCGITKEVSAKTMNQKSHADGWEFDLQADVSLKVFKLEPPSVLFGAISVADKVVVKAHVLVKKDTSK